MELDDRGCHSIGTTDPVYKYPLGNPNVMEAHIFQLKRRRSTNMGEHYVARKPALLTLPAL